MYNQYTQFHQTIINYQKIEQPLLIMNLGDVGTPLANDLAWGSASSQLSIPT